MSSTGAAKKYHAPSGIEYQSNEELERWAGDPNCIEQSECAAILTKRKELQAAELVKLQAQWAAKRKELEENPFDPRTEVSADAKHIANKVVTHLWILFVALPIVLGILYSILAH
jgi:hypothetical protein